MDKKRSNIIPLVFHRVVPNSCKERFEDVDLSTFTKIIEMTSVKADNKRESSITGNRSSSVLITFDDGNITDFDTVFPLLQGAQLDAHFFIVTSLIGSPGHLNWDQVTQMQKGGMTFGSHSKTHLDMCQLSEKERVREFQESKEVIEDRLGVSVESFSFPFGKFNKTLVYEAKLLGYKNVYTSQHGVLDSKSDFYPRNSINGSMSIQLICRILNAGPLMRLKWVVEDDVKRVMKSALGDDLYKKYRKSYLS